VSTGGSVFGATLTVVFTCLMIGLIMGAVVGLTSVPAWAVSLGAGAVIQGGLLAAYGSQLVPLRDRDAGLQGSDFIVWTALFMVVSLAGAATFALPAVRGALTPGRPAVEEAGFSGGRLLRAIVGLGGSSALAALAGVLLTRRIQAGSPVATDLLVVGLAVVVLGGVSVYGRRGGVAGVALAVLLVALVRHWMTVEGAEAATQYMVSGVLLVVGLLVSWGLDLVARRAERL
jgi:ribose/xylose/arabinose/galactoside ABC-type transport system permease subunit